jgi:prepilin signal peptidase PulO-like enzyme (type II secretory pathway)
MVAGRPLLIDDPPPLGTVGYVTAQPWWLLALYGFLFGSVWASFAAVVVERTARRESLGGRSHCVCGRQLRATENIPIVGWLRSGGKARCCGSSIPVWYVLFEVVLGICGALVAGSFGLVALAVFLLGFTVLCRFYGLSRRPR